jgi:ribonuclease HII
MTKPAMRAAKPNAAQLRARKVQKAGPDFVHERAWIARGHGLVAGIDEAGRGPWAGPVVAAAVILDAGAIPEGINDSKALKPADRERLYEEIVRHAEVGVGIADVDRIDRDNILHATLWAMGQAVASLPRPPGAALVDGNISPRLLCAIETLVAGDARSLSIAAASIVAKVTRDRMMVELARAHPGYGWERNMGYGVPEHQQGIARHGLTPHHRRSFKPIALAARGSPPGTDEH